MGKILFIIVSLIFVYKIWTNVGANKLPWVFAGILFFPQTIILFEKPYMPFPRFIIFALFFTMVLQNKSWWQNYKVFPLYIATNFLVIMCLCVGLFDTRLDLFLKIYRPVYFLLENFLIVFLTFFYLKTVKQALNIYTSLFIYFGIFAMYGLVNYFTGVSLYNSIISEIYSSIDFGNRYTEIGDARFRISSFAWHPIYYGFLLSIVILLGAYFALIEKVRSKKQIYLALIFLFTINIIWTNSRTPILALIVGLCTFLIFGLRLKSKIKLFFIGIITFFSVAMFSPTTPQIIEETINTFSSKGSKLEGSSVQMRDIQLLASFGLFVQKPYFGHGFGYIFEDLGYSTNKDNRTSDSDFAGFESYSYKLLIEQGIAGIASTIFFFLGLIFYLLKRIKQVDEVMRKFIFVTIGITVTFLLFIFGTGDLGAFTIFMAILGLNVKTIELKIANKRTRLVQNNA